jgi:hypothetical protein
MSMLNHRTRGFDTTGGSISRTLQPPHLELFAQTSCPNFMLTIIAIAAPRLRTVHPFVAFFRDRGRQLPWAFRKWRPWDTGWCVPITRSPDFASDAAKALTDRGQKLDRGFLALE